MKALSNTQQNKLKDAINEIMDSCGSVHDNPNKVIAKTAQDMHLSKDYIPILVRAYNTGVQGAIRDDAHTIEEKTASFPLASEDEINNILYSGSYRSKQASYDEEIDDFFNHPATFYFGNLLEPVIPQEAYTTKKAAYKRDNQKDFQLEQNVFEKTQALQEQFRFNKSATAEDFDDAIKELGYELEKVTAPSPEYFKKFASIVFDKEGEIVANEVINRFGLTKRKSFLANPSLTKSSAIYKCLENAVEKHIKYNNACDGEYKMAAYCVKVLKPQATKRIQNLYNDFDADCILKRGDLRRSKEAAGPFLSPQKSLSAGLVPPAYVQDSISALTAPDYSSLSPLGYNIMVAMDDPEHEAKLRSIKLESMVADLMATDEYLSKQDPEEVIIALNELLELNPGLHNKMALLRPALRSYMETGGYDVAATGAVIDAVRKADEPRNERRKEHLSERADKNRQWHSWKSEDDRRRYQEEVRKDEKEIREKERKEDQKIRKDERKKDQEIREKERKEDQKIRKQEREEDQNIRAQERNVDVSNRASEFNAQVENRSNERKEDKETRVNERAEDERNKRWYFDEEYNRRSRERAEDKANRMTELTQQHNWRVADWKEDIKKREEWRKEDDAFKHMELNTRAQMNHDTIFGKEVGRRRSELNKRKKYLYDQAMKDRNEPEYIYTMSPAMEELNRMQAGSVIPGTSGFDITLPTFN